MWLRKYTAVFKTSFRESLAYRFDALASTMFAFIKIYLAFILWRAIFADKTLIGSFTFPMMLTYYILISFIERIGRSENIIWETSEEVRTGSYTKYITRPISHFLYALSRSFSKSSFALITSTIACTFWVIIFRKSIYIPSDPMAVLFAVLFTILGLFTLTQIHYIIGLISFKTIDIAGPYFLINNFVGFMAGSFIPIALLPDMARNIISFTPFYYVMYYPVSIYLEQDKENMFFALAVIIVWNLLLMFFRKFFYKKMISLFEGVGV